MSLYDWKEKDNSRRAKFSAIRTSALYYNHSSLNTMTKSMKNLSGILDKYDKHHNDYSTIKKADTLIDPLTSKLLVFQRSYTLSSLKYSPMHSISLHKIISNAKVNSFNGLEVADPVVQITKSFKTSVPEPDNDFFEMITKKTVNYQNKVNLTNAKDTDDSS